MDEYHPARIQCGNKENTAGEDGAAKKNNAAPVSKFHGKLSNLPALK